MRLDAAWLAPFTPTGAITLCASVLLLAAALRWPLRVPWPTTAAGASAVAAFAIVVFAYTGHGLITAILAGIPVVCCIGLLPAQHRLERVWWALTRDRRYVTAPEIIDEDVGRKELRKRLDDFLARDTGERRLKLRVRITITGYDGNEAFLRHLLKHGCDLTLYTSAGTGGAHPALDHFVKYAREHGGVFRHRRLAPPSAIWDDYDSHLITMLATYRPSFASNDNDDEMVWLERHHMYGTDVSRDCSYYSPKCLRAEPQPFHDALRLTQRAWDISVAATPDPTKDRLLAAIRKTTA